MILLTSSPDTGGLSFIFLAAVHVPVFIHSFFYFGLEELGFCMAVVLQWLGLVGLSSLLP